MKKYIKPAIEVIKLETEVPLAASGDFGGSGSDLPWAPSESSEIDWDNYSMSNFGPEMFDK